MITSIFVDIVPISNGVTDALCPGVACGCGRIRGHDGGPDDGRGAPYGPWTIGHQPIRDVEAVLDQIEQALGRL